MANTLQLVENIARKLQTRAFSFLQSWLRFSCYRKVNWSRRSLSLFFASVPLFFIVDLHSDYCSHFALSVAVRAIERDCGRLRWVTKRNGCFHYNVATLRRRNWLRGRYFATLHARRKNPATDIIDLRPVVYQWYSRDTSRKLQPGRSRLGRGREKNGHGFPNRSIHFSLDSGIRFRGMRAQSWNLTPRRANRQCQLRSRSRFDAPFPTADDATSKISQSIFCTRHMLGKSSLPFAHLDRGMLFITLSL